MISKSDKDLIAIFMHYNTSLPTEVMLCGTVSLSIGIFFTVTFKKTICLSTSHI